MKTVKTGATEWQNCHETFTDPINDLYELGNEPALDPLAAYNDTRAGLQALIGKAIADNTTLRAIGAGWSWTKITTPGQGILVDTKSLNLVFSISEKSVHQDYTGDIGKLFFAQCGNGIWELNKFLQNRKLSLKTSGASNGQTIAGVLGTGAHGSAFDFGAVQDFVVGLHIITGAGKHVWLERASAPVVSTTFINNIQTELIQDDDLFYAALISFGSFGFICGVMIETEDVFLLESYMQRMPYDASLQHIMETLDFSNAALPCGTERPFHFAVSINPYDMAGGAYVTTMYKRPYRDNYDKPTENAAGVGPGDDAAVFVGHLTDVIPALVPKLVNKLLAGAMTPYSKKMGTVGEIFNNTTLHGKLLSSAMGIPLSYVNRVTKLMIELNGDKGPFTGLFAYRFVKGSKATLAFTRFEQTCVFELDAAFSKKTLAFFSEVWKKLDEENIPFTFHWGKINELDPDRLSRMYGPNMDTWIQARNTLLDPDTRKVFSNALIRSWGLDS